jgi:hypothetical protein
MSIMLLLTIFPAFTIKLVFTIKSIYRAKQHGELQFKFV